MSLLCDTCQHGSDLFTASSNKSNKLNKKIHLCIFHHSRSELIPNNTCMAMALVQKLCVSVFLNLHPEPSPSTTHVCKK